MNNYIDFIYYKNTYKGDMSEDEFNKVVTRASMEIRRNIFNRNITDYENEVKFATCSVADSLYKINTFENKKENTISDKNIKTESVKDYSRTFETISLIDIDVQITNLKAKIKKEIRLYLLDTGLMYRGV